MSRPASLRERLDPLLMKVTKPGQYLALERNQVVKDWDAVAVRVCLAFPDSYEIGMSHSGSKILYHLVSQREDALCERVYAPWTDMKEAMDREEVPLFTIETATPAGSFDLLAFTLQTELNYSNVPWMLDLAGVPRRAEDRGEEHPLVVAGGPCMANPEPVAPFFDALAIGDGELLMPALVDLVRRAKEEGWPRLEVLRRLASTDGLYVPRFYDYDFDGPRITAIRANDDAAPEQYRRVWVDELDPATFPDQPVVPGVEIVQDRIGMEIMRGCTQGCRFCQAGYWYRPVREHDPASVAEKAKNIVSETGYEQVGLLSLSSADYSQIEPLAHRLSQELSPKRVSIGLPSLRAEAFSVNLAEAVSTVRKGGFTFAPETGSDRLRKYINKTFTNADMVEAAHVAYSKGWDLIKIYTMIGLPTETEADLDELVQLVYDILDAGKQYGRNKRVKVSIGCFSPKSWTPFQWEPFDGVERLEEKVRYIRSKIRTGKAKITWSDPRETAMEVTLSRGDRRMADVIEAAVDRGVSFDGWEFGENRAAWEEAFAAAGVDPEWYLRRWEQDEILPWDNMDAGLTKRFLQLDLKRADRGKEVEDCKWGTCYNCGIPGNGEDIKLAQPTLPTLNPDGSVNERPEAMPKAAAYRQRPAPLVLGRPELEAQPDTAIRYRLAFAKEGDARYLSHRNLMDLFERALRGGSTPVRFTEGFNPRAKMSMGPALSLGVESRHEVFDIETHRELTEEDMREIGRRMVAGVRLLGIDRLEPGDKKLSKAVAAAIYTVRAPAGESFPVAETLPEGVIECTEIESGTWKVTTNLDPTRGPVFGPRRMLELLFAIEGDAWHAWRLVRERTVLHEDPASASTARRESFAV